MKHIWSPWRMDFILGPKKGKCPFCRPDGLVLFEGADCYVLMNRFPYNNGHLLVIPYKHKKELCDLDSATMQEMMALTAASVKVLKKALKCEGANCGMNIGHIAGAGIADHIHMHVVPRWRGDYNFLPVIGDVKSMPEYLEKTYGKLKPFFDKLR